MVLREKWKRAWFWLEKTKRRSPQKVRSIYRELGGGAGTEMTKAYCMMRMWIFCGLFQVELKTRSQWSVFLRKIWRHGSIELPAPTGRL